MQQEWPCLVSQTRVQATKKYCLEQEQLINSFRGWMDKWKAIDPHAVLTNYAITTTD